jgi:DNA-binding MarR family transcriptional regulator
MSANSEMGLLMNLLGLNTTLQKRLNGRLSMHGLSWSDFLVLQVLAAEPGQTMRRVDLAERVGLTASGVTRLLNPMEKIGLVDKQASDHDARVSLVALTAAGARLLEDSRVAVADLAEEVFGQLDPGRRQALDETLARVKSVA